MTQPVARSRQEVRKEAGAEPAAAMPQKSRVNRRRHLPAAAGRRDAGRNLPGSKGHLLKRVLTRRREDLRPGGRRSRLMIKNRADVLVPVVVAAQRRQLQGKLPTPPGAQRAPLQRARRLPAGTGLRGRRPDPEMTPAVRAGVAQGATPLHEEGNPRPVRRRSARRLTWSGRSWSMPSSPQKSA